MREQLDLARSRAATGLTFGIGFGAVFAALIWLNVEPLLAGFDGGSCFFLFLVDFKRLSICLILFLVVFLSFFLSPIFCFLCLVNN